MNTNRFIVWGPQGSTNPRVVHSTLAEAEKAASEMAQRNRAVFHVCAIVATARITTVSVMGRSEAGVRIAEDEAEATRQQRSEAVTGAIQDALRRMENMADELHREVEAVPNLHMYAYAAMDASGDVWLFQYEPVADHDLLEWAEEGKGEYPPVKIGTMPSTISGLLARKYWDEVMCILLPF